MSLSEPQQRRAVHHRHVESCAYRRDDGLWDIEARLRDTKAYDMKDFRRGLLPAGSPVHDMSLRVTIDADLMVRAVESTSDAVPFDGCAGTREEFSALVGTRLGKGLLRKVREHFGGTRGCTHLLALFEPVATTALQALCGGPDPRGEDPLAWPPLQQQRPFFVGGCRGWREDGPTVAVVFRNAAWRRGSSE